MLLLGQEHWSHTEVRKLVALIATEHLRAQAALDALAIPVGLMTQDLRVIWANQPLRDLASAMQAPDSSAREAVERAARTGATCEVVVGEEQVQLQISPSKVIAGEFVVVGLKGFRAASSPQLGFATLDHCEVPVLAYTNEGQILFANSRAVELTGYTREALPTLRLADLYPQHHGLLLSPGEYMVTMQNSSGPGVPMQCRVKLSVLDGAEALFLTVVFKEHEISTYAANLAALEGCLVGAFPDSTVSRMPSQEPHRHRFRIITDTEERVLSVTDEALRSPQFRAHLREVPEALNFTRTVLLGQDGVRVE